MTRNSGNGDTGKHKKDVAVLCNLPAKRAQILRGAERVFLTHGYERASMSAIAEAAGVSKGTIYSHFAGKDALFSTFFEEQAQESFATIQAISRADDQCARDALLQLAETVVTLLVTPACLTLHRIIVGEAIRFPNLAETFWRYGFGRTRANLSEWLVRRMDAGELRSADPDFAAEQFLLLCQARIVIHRRFMLPVDDSPEAIRTFATITANDFMRLYGARGL